MQKPLDERGEPNTGQDIKEEVKIILEEMVQRLESGWSNVTKIKGDIEHQIKASGGQDPGDLLEKAYLEKFREVQRRVETSAGTLVSLTDEVKLAAAKMSGGAPDACADLVSNATAAQDFVKGATADVLVMANNVSTKIDQIVDCFNKNSTPTTIVSPKEDENVNSTDPCPPGSDGTVCQAFSKADQPLSDTLDCLDQRLGELETLRQSCVARLEMHEQELAGWSGKLYSGLKLCLFEPGPTKGPGMASGIFADPALLVFAVVLGVAQLRT